MIVILSKKGEKDRLDFFPHSIINLFAPSFRWQKVSLEKTLCVIYWTLCPDKLLSIRSSCLPPQNLLFLPDFICRGGIRKADFEFSCQSNFQ